jgi:hypothetical protein
MKTRFFFESSFAMFIISVAVIMSFLTHDAWAIQVTANSCSQSDVQQAVNQVISSGSGMVSVPAGTCTWASTVSVNTGALKNIRIIGAGQGLTNIADFRLSIPASGSNIVELAHMTIGGSSQNGAIFTEKFRPANNPGGKELNVHHLTIAGRGPIGNIEGWIGVVHHNTFTCRSGQYGWYVHGVGTTYDTNEPPAGYGSRNLLYFEDNVFDGCYHSISGFCNSKIAFRHNTVKNATHCVDVHGPSYNYCYQFGTGGSGDDRKYGGRYLEHYNNTYESSCVCGLRVRSGSVISTANNYNFTPSSYSKISMKIDGGSGQDNCQSCSKSLSYTAVSAPHCGGAVCQGPQMFYIWGENSNGSACGAGECFDVAQSDVAACNSCLSEGTNYVFRTPSQVQDGFTWTPYAYPHPLTYFSYTVTPSAGANGSIAPNTPQIVASGNTIQFTVTPNNGYTATVGGTCGGTLVGAIYTTNAINGNCTVKAYFNPAGGGTQKRPQSPPDVIYK